MYICLNKLRIHVGVCMCTRVHTSSDAKMVKRIHHSKYHKHCEKGKVFRGKKNSDNQAENRTRYSQTHAISSAKNTEKLWWTGWLNK